MKKSQPTGRYDHIDVRVNEEEKATAQELAAELGFRGAADLVRLIIGSLEVARAKGKGTSPNRRRKASIHIHLPNRADAKQVSWQLAAIGNNHNQIAYKLNSLALNGSINFGENVSAEELAHDFHSTTQALESLKATLRNRC